MKTAPGLPLRAIEKARSISQGTRSGRVARAAHFVTGRIRATESSS